MIKTTKFNSVRYKANEYRMDELKRIEGVAQSRKRMECRRQR